MKLKINVIGQVPKSDDDERNLQNWSEVYVADWSEKFRYRTGIFPASFV